MNRGDSKTATQKKTVVIIEDEPWFSEAYGRKLKNAGFGVHAAPTAQEGIDIIDKHGRVDLIILDLFLPEHNGFAVIHHLQSYSDWQEIPVVVLTSTDPGAIALDESDWREHGVKHFAQKGKIHPDELVAKAQELVTANHEPDSD